MHEHDVTSIFKQKLIKIDDFDMEEEKQVKERVEERKIKRRKVAKKTSCWKKEKVENNKKTEKEMWDRFKELNKNFKDIKEPKKKSKKMSKTILKKIYK